MGFGQVVDNMNNNFKRMFSPGNIMLALTSVGIRQKLGVLKDYRKDIADLDDQRFAYGAGAIGFATRGIRSLMYLKECQKAYQKYLRLFANPNSVSITEDMIDKDIEFLEEQFDRYQSYKKANLKTALLLQRSEVLSYMDSVIKAASDINSEPSKTISSGYKLLEELRKKRHAAENSKLVGTKKLEEVKRNLEKAEDCFKFWEKFKQYTFRLLNDDLHRAVHNADNFLCEVSDNEEHAKKHGSVVAVNLEAAFGEKWNKNYYKERDRQLQELPDDEA